MTWLYVSILSLFICLSGNSQRLEIMLIPYEDQGLWGYVNAKDSIILQPKFEEAYPTYDLRGRIKLKGKYGYINEKGKVVIKPKYETATDYMHGIASVTHKGKVMIINTEGKVNTRGIALCGGVYRNCLQPKSLYGIDTVAVNDGYLVSYNRRDTSANSYAYDRDTLDMTFDAIESLGRQYIIASKDGKKALFFDSKRYRDATHLDTSIVFKYQDFKFFPCQDEAYPKEVFGFKRNDKWGYIRLFYEPKEIVEAKYYSISDMNRGLALVEYEPDKYGYISLQGQEFFTRRTIQSDSK